MNYIIVQVAVKYLYIRRSYVCPKSVTVRDLVRHVGQVVRYPELGPNSGTRPSPTTKGVSRGIRKFYFGRILGPHVDGTHLSLFGCSGGP